MSWGHIAKKTWSWAFQADLYDFESGASVRLEWGVLGALTIAQGIGHRQPVCMRADWNTWKTRPLPLFRHSVTLMSLQGHRTPFISVWHLVSHLRKLNLICGSWILGGTGESLLNTHLATT